MIKGKEREVKEYSKYVGVGEFNVLGFNLTKDEIAHKCGYEPKTEPVYIRKTGEGKDSVSLTVFLKEKTTGELFRTTFFIEDKVKTTNDGRKQYVNNKAMSSYVLQDWFTGNVNNANPMGIEYREAYVGEADFFNFLKNWLSNFDWFQDPDAKIELDQTEKIIGGNVKMLNDLANRYGNKQTIGFLTGVKVTDGKEYQDVYNKACLPGYLVKSMQGLNKNITAREIDSQKYGVKQFLKQVTGQYGYSNYFGNSFTFRVYNSNENITNTTGIVTQNSAVTDDIAY